MFRSLHARVFLVAVLLFRRHLAIGRSTRRQPIRRHIESVKLNFHVQASVSNSSQERSKSHFTTFFLFKFSAAPVFQEVQVAVVFVDAVVVVAAAAVDAIDVVVVVVIIVVAVIVTVASSSCHCCY